MSDGASPGEHPQRTWAPPFDSLRITAAALHKARAYARLVVEQLGSAECAGFLLGAGPASAVDDVTLAPRQEVDGVSVVIDEVAVLAAGREIESRGRVAVGWWHSHGIHAAHHSSVDDATSVEVLEQLALSNRVTVGEPPREVGFVFSLVVNACGGPACAEVFVTQGPGDEAAPAHRRVPIAIVPAFDPEALRAEVAQRVRKTVQRSSRPTRRAP